MTSVNAERTVMIVDDEPAIVMLMKRQLEGRGFSVKTAGDAFEALDAIRQISQDEEIKLIAILLDFKLEGMNGLEALSEIRKLDVSLPVIMVTGNHDESDARRAIECGAFDYVTKPVDFSYLNRILSAY